MSQLIYIDEKKQEESENGRKKRTERVGIAKKYALNGTDGIMILEAAKATKVEKKKKEEEKERKREEKEREKEEKRQENEEKKRKREDISCKIEECTRVWKNKSGFDEQWIWCSHCDGFGICWGCAPDKKKRRVVFNHKRACKKKK